MLFFVQNIKKPAILYNVTVDTIQVEQLYFKDETALKALLEFNFDKDNYVCIEPKGFSIQLSTKTINGSIKELNDKWTELCKEKYVEEYEDNEFIPESYKYINW